MLKQLTIDIFTLCEVKTLNAVSYQDSNVESLQRRRTCRLQRHLTAVLLRDVNRVSRDSSDTISKHRTSHEYWKTGPPPANQCPRVINRRRRGFMAALYFYDGFMTRAPRLSQPLVALLD
ncbi:hypothetical protein EVAR_17756_1 [Eumeta japonica]|uniref:Uncharacterized protein n=1 Tax=Eumeta variegata TaxID=151549 RepID=A0A4C1TTP0_EUMVA|nr:hypothetical protein EVAR_17756_1 [Eumeta japonica]